MLFFESVTGCSLWQANIENKIPADEWWQGFLIVVLNDLSGNAIGIDADCTGMR